MRITVIGGTGRIGSRTVTRLAALGHDVVAASRATGVDTTTGEGVADAIDGADVVIDVTRPASLEPKPALAFFLSSTGNLLAAEAAAGVKRHVALSVVGINRMLASGYFRAKLAQEILIRAGSIPYTIVRSTQFYEFATSIADAATIDGVVRLPRVLAQPIAADDVAEALSRAALAPAINDTTDIAGPQRIPLDEWIRRALQSVGDRRPVVADPNALYFGWVQLGTDTLLPGPNAISGKTRLEEWLAPVAKSISLRGAADMV